MILQIARISNRCILQQNGTKNCFTFLPPRLSSSRPDASPSSSRSQTATGLEGYTTIYRFPHIRFVATLSRLKLVQTGFTVVAVPATGVLSSMGYVSPEAYNFCIGICGLALVMLYAVTTFTRRTVGFMYLDEGHSNLRVAYLNFWGSRRDVVIPVKDVIPLNDLSEYPNNVYVTLCRYSNAQKLFYSLRYGTVLDKEKFEHVFGCLDTR